MMRRTTDNHEKKELTLITILLVGISLAGCGDSTQPKNSHPSSTTKVIKSITRKDYDQIKLANITAPTKGGSSLNSIRQSFGSPTSHHKVSLSGTSKKSAIQYSWNQLDKGFKASAVTVEFLDGHAIGKGYVLKHTTHRQYTSVESINSLNPGDSYESVIQRLGEPDSESVTGSGDMAATSALYLTSKKGAAVNLMFTGGQLQSKNQTTTK